MQIRKYQHIFYNNQLQLFIISILSNLRLRFKCLQLGTIQVSYLFLENFFHIHINVRALNKTKRIHF